MREYPFDGCPSAADLRAYVEGSADATFLKGVLPAIRKHLLGCEACSGDAAGLSQRFAQNQVRSRFDTDSDSSVHSLLETQREYLRRLGSRRIDEADVGQIWATTIGRPIVASASSPRISSVVVVLRTFFRELTGKFVADVVPVTDDPILASEWSVVFPPDRSGSGNYLVAHVDAQFTTDLSFLARYIGSLPQESEAELLLVVSAFEAGEPPPTGLLFVTLGQSTVRDLPGWERLISELTDIVRQLVVDDTDSDDDAEEWTSALRIGSRPHMSSAGGHRIYYAKTSMQACRPPATFGTAMADYLGVTTADELMIVCERLNVPAKAALAIADIPVEPLLRTYDWKEFLFNEEDLISCSLSPGAKRQLLASLVVPVRTQLIDECLKPGNMGARAARGPSPKPCS